MRRISSFGKSLWVTLLLGWTFSGLSLAAGDGIVGGSGVAGLVTPEQLVKSGEVTVMKDEDVYVQVVKRPELGLTIVGIGKGAKAGEPPLTTSGLDYCKLGTGVDTDGYITGERYVFGPNLGVYMAGHYTYVYAARWWGAGWYRPDGSTYWEDIYVSQIPNPKDHGYDYWLWYNVISYYSTMPADMQSVEGRWTAVLYDEGVATCWKTFTVMYEVSDHTMCGGAQDSPPYDPLDVRQHFWVADTAAFCWVRLDNYALNSANDVSYDWYGPQGYYQSSEVDIIDPGVGNWYEWVKCASGVFVKGYYPATQPGAWEVDVNVKDYTGAYETRLTEHFTIFSYIALPTFLQEYAFKSGNEGWAFRIVPPTALHYSYWANASSVEPDSAIGLSTPFDEATNYFALWDSLGGAPVPYYANSVYQVDWVFSTSRDTTNAVPSLRFRIGLSNQKAFASSRVYPGDWLPLLPYPYSTMYQQFFEPPIASDSLFLAFSLIDWNDDFRGSGPAGVVYLEEVSVYRHDPVNLYNWQAGPAYSGSAFNSWTASSHPYYSAASSTREGDGSLTLSSGIGADRVYGFWDSPASIFSVSPNQLHRVTAHMSSQPQLGGPDLRIRVHTDDYRCSWNTYYASSYTAGESALPAEAGQDCRLYLTLPGSVPQSCHCSVDLIDFSSAYGGSLTLHSLAEHSHPY